MNDAARMLLLAFEELRGMQPHEEARLEAERFAKMPLAPELVVQRMRAVAARSGPGWRPSRLRYFRNVFNDLLAEPRPTVATQGPAVSVPLSQENHEQAMASLRALETPEQGRRADLVGTLQPRATLHELKYLLFDRMDGQEFGRRLEQCRLERQRQAS